MLEKAHLYDWNGANEQIFSLINSIRGDWYDAGMVWLTLTGEHEHFPYIMAVLGVTALVRAVACKIAGKAGARMLLARWMGVLVVLTASYGATGMATRALKEEFAYPRPYAVVEQVRVLEIEAETDKSRRSFPSGHAVFITMMAVGLWPVLSGSLRLLAVLMVAGVCYSRIAVGMHFPADVAGGFLIGLAITLIVRRLVYAILRKFGLPC